MGLKDRHDKRLFAHYVKLTETGSVAAIVEVADGLPAPTAGVYVDVTDVRREKRAVDLYAVAVDAKTLQASADLPEANRPSLAVEFRAALDATIKALPAPVLELPPVIASADGRL